MNNTDWSQEIKLEELFDVLRLILSISESSKNLSWWASNNTIYIGDSIEEPSYIINKNRDYKEI